MSERRLPEHDDPESEVAKVGGTTYIFGRGYGRVDVNLTATLRMSAEVRDAMVKVSENQYAIPAQEETKRAQEETKRFRLRAFIYPPTVLVGIVSMALCPSDNAKSIMLALIGVLGSFEGFQAVERWISKKRPPR